MSSRSRRGRHGGHGIERRRRRALQVRWGMREAERASSSSWGRGEKISRRRQGGRRWRPYPPRGACSSVAGEVVRRRRPCCGLRPRNRAGGRETAARGHWAGSGGLGGPAQVGSVQGGGLLSLSSLFLFFNLLPFYLFSFSVIVLHPIILVLVKYILCL